MGRQFKSLWDSWATSRATKGFFEKNIDFDNTVSIFGHKCMILLLLSQFSVVFGGAVSRNSAWGATAMTLYQTLSLFRVVPLGDLKHVIPVGTVTKKRRRERRRGFNNIGFQPDCQLKVAFGNKNLYFLLGLSAKVAFENKRNLYLLLRLSAKS